jgi:hypothetical protein
MADVQERLEIERPIEELTRLLGTRPSDWLLPFLRIAAQAGDEAGRRATHFVPELSRELAAHVEISDAALADDAGLDEVSFPVRWRTAGYAWIARRFTGEIRVRRRGSGSAELSISGTCEPPTGPAHGPATIANRALVVSLLRTLRDAVEEQARSAV